MKQPKLSKRRTVSKLVSACDLRDLGDGSELVLGGEGVDEAVDREEQRAEALHGHAPQQPRVYDVV